MNPFMMLVQMIRGGNPQQIIQDMMNNSQITQNPMARQVINMAKQGDMQGLNTMAQNMCREKGTTVDEVKDSLMRQFGMKY